METTKIGWHYGESPVATWFAYSSKAPREADTQCQQGASWV